MEQSTFKQNMNVSRELRESSFAEKTFAVFPTLVFGGNSWKKK